MLFHNFKWLNIKAATSHCHISQEVDELLTKGAIEPSIGNAGFYSNVYVVPKCTGDLQSALNLKQFIHFIHIADFLDAYYQKGIATYSAN